MDQVECEERDDRAINETQHLWEVTALIALVAGLACCQNSILLGTGRISYIAKPKAT